MLYALKAFLNKIFTFQKKKLVKGPDSVPVVWVSILLHEVKSFSPYALILIALSQIFV